MGHESECTPDLTVLQCKFQAYLSWSQPFLHELLQGTGHHVTNVVLCERTENQDRFPVERLVRIPKSAQVRPTRALLMAAGLHARWKPRVIHAHFGWSGIRMLLLKHFLGIPMVTTFGGRDLNLQAALPELKPLYDALLHASERIICVSESLRRTALSRGADPDRTEVVHRGTRLDRFRPVDRSGRGPERPVRVLMVGRFVEKKGHADALAALNHLARQATPVELRIVGEGEEEPRIRRLAGELGIARQVTFTGILQHDAVRREMEEADIFLHCSITPPSGDSEGLPNALVEAAATGLPVIGTRHGGIVEAVQDRRTGLLVDERDVPALARAVGRLSADAALRRSWGDAGACLMQAEFDLDRQVERHVEIYRELASAHPPGAARLPSPLVEQAFHEQLELALHHHGEFSISELIEAQLAPQRWMEEGWPAWIERSYELKRYVPPAFKYPVKRGIGRALSRFGDAGIRLLGKAVVDAHLERNILTEFGPGMDLARVNPRWTPEGLAERWPKLVSDAPTQEH